MSQLALALRHVAVSLFLAPDHGRFRPFELVAQSRHLLQCMRCSLLQVLRAGSRSTRETVGRGANTQCQASGAKDKASQCDHTDKPFAISATSLEDERKKKDTALGQNNGFERCAPGVKNVRQRNRRKIYWP